MPEAPAAAAWLLAVAAAAPPLEAAREARAAPSALASPVRAVLDPRAATIRSGEAVLLRLWPRLAEPPTAPASESPPFRALYRTLPGALVGAMEVSGELSDGKGQRIPPGVYTLRYALQPLMKEHVGTAAHRDFLLLLPARLDRRLAAPADPELILRRSRAVAGAPHPAVLELLLSAEAAVRLRRDGEGRTVLDVGGGALPFAVVVGAREGAARPPGAPRPRGAGE